MSMIFCRGCGKELHESAVNCPHCGAPQSSAPADLKKENSKARKPMWLKILIVIFALLSLCSWQVFLSRLQTRASRSEYYVHPT